MGKLACFILMFSTVSVMVDANKNWEEGNKDQLPATLMVPRQLLRSQSHPYFRSVNEHTIKKLSHDAESGWGPNLGAEGVAEPAAVGESEVDDDAEHGSGDVCDVPCDMEAEDPNEACPPVCDCIPDDEVSDDENTAEVDDDTFDHLYFCESRRNHALDG